MMNDTLSTALSKIMNAEKVGKKECLIKPVSQVIKQVLGILNQHSYVGMYEEIADGRGGILKMNLLGNMNKCGSIKPRFSVKLNDFVILTGINNKNDIFEAKFVYVKKVATTPTKTASPSSKIKKN